ncbi:MAG: hypothetical protein WAK35_09235 [Xanthobacteraceae bacterium]
MSFHRVVLVAVATLFSVGMTSIASAGCCGWGYSAPVAYAAVAPAVYGGGCGACGAPTAAAVYAAPVAPAVPAPIVVSAVVPSGFGGPCCSWNGCGNCGWSGWSSGCGNCGGGWSGAGGCGNCGGCGSCGQAVVYAQPSLYVVNQGPVYAGPGIMTPYQTYSPETAYVAATDYPYVPGSGYGYGYGAVPPSAPYYRHAYFRPRFAYRTPVAMHPYMHPRYYGAPRWRHYP